MRQGGGGGGTFTQGEASLSLMPSAGKNPEKSLFKDTSVPARVYRQRAVTLAHTRVHTHTHPRHITASL